MKYDLFRTVLMLSLPLLIDQEHLANTDSVVGNGEPLAAAVYIDNTIASLPTAPNSVALRLDGIDDYAIIPAGAINDLTEGTIEARIYLNSIDAEAITTKQHDGVNTMAHFTIGSAHHWFEPGVPGKLYFKGHNTDTGEASSIRTIEAGDWYDVAVAFSSSRVSFFINGQLDSTTNGDYSVPDDLAATTTVGVFYRSGAGVMYFDGYIRELRIWNRALGEADIRAGMNLTITGNERGLVACYNIANGTARDLTTNGYHAQLLGGAEIVAGGNNDYDGDGLPDQWEIEHGLNPLANDTAEDADADGLSNYEEYLWNLTHTNKLDPQSFFSTGPHISDYELVTGARRTAFATTKWTDS